MHLSAGLSPSRRTCPKIGLTWPISTDGFKSDSHQLTRSSKHLKTYCVCTTKILPWPRRDMMHQRDSLERPSDSTSPNDSMNRLFTIEAKHWGDRGSENHENLPFCIYNFQQPFFHPFVEPQLSKLWEYEERVKCFRLSSALINFKADL